MNKKLLLSETRPALPFDVPAWNDSQVDSETVHLEQLYAAFRRQWLVVLVCILVGIGAGAAYLRYAVPIYSASTSVMIDRADGRGLGPTNAVSVAPEDDSAVTSEVELLSSKAIAYLIIDRLQLHDDPRFLTQPQSLSARLIRDATNLLEGYEILASTPKLPMNEEQRRRIALGLLQRNTTVSRVEQAYVLKIRYQSPSAETAAKIAAAYAEAYVIDKLDSKFESTRRSSEWLQDRIEELATKANETDLAVQLFREQHGLVTADGKLVSDQQLSELNSALIIARSDTAQAKARLERIQRILDAGDAEAIVPDVLESTISNDLRSKYLDAAKREAEVSNRYGKQHGQALRLRAEMQEYKNLMFQELRRIAESYRSAQEVALARESELERRVAEAEARSSEAGKTQVQLRELQRSAETYRKLHESFLQRYQESLQAQSFPVTGARIIEPAEVATRPSFPNVPITLALFAVLGGVAGAGVGGVREMRDKFFRTGEQVRKVLGENFFGAMPLVSNIYDPRKRHAMDRKLQSPNSITNYAASFPLTRFAETLRSIKIAISLKGAATDGHGKIVGFISALPGEGKSTAAINFAQLVASQGSRVLLIDADQRNPGATRMLIGSVEGGLADVVLSSKSIEELIWKDADTGLLFLPSHRHPKAPHAADMLASEAMGKLINGAADHFDYVVLDLPPLGPIIDARAASRWIQHFVLVVEWGRTSQKMVVETLAVERDIRAKLRGVILNKMNSKKLSAYQSYGSAEYYYPTYQKYYTE